ASLQKKASFPAAGSGTTGVTAPRSPKPALRRDVPDQVQYAAALQYRGDAGRGFRPPRQSLEHGAQPGSLVAGAVLRQGDQQTLNVQCTDRKRRYQWRLPRGPQVAARPDSC